MMVTASEDSSLGPAVDFPQPVNEQCHPARVATAVFVLFLKSSRLLIRQASLPTAPLAFSSQTTLCMLNEFLDTRYKLESLLYNIVLRFIWLDRNWDEPSIFIVGIKQMLDNSTITLLFVELLYNQTVI
jgi:hypothetical protein